MSTHRLDPMCAHLCLLLFSEDKLLILWQDLRGELSAVADDLDFVELERRVGSRDP